MMHKSKIEKLLPEPQQDSNTTADELPSAQVLPNPMLKETIVKEFSNKAIWEYACRTILKDISQTFLSKSNQNKADKSRDKDIFQALGETIKNFPIPEYRAMS